MWNEDPELKTIIHAPAVKHDALVDGVIVPGLQAAISGGLFGLAAAVLAALAGVPDWWKWGGGVFVSALLLTWLSYRHGWQWRLERLLGLDLNLDGSIGRPSLPALPEPEPQRIRVVLEQQGGREVDFIDLPARPEQLQALASGITQGRTFALTAWAGTFTRPEFEGLRDELIKRGLARWANERSHNQGIVLTPAGRAVMRRLAEQPPTPSDRQP